jgi:pimeloyl-ACP methyl ester carboxylesterase
MLLPLLALDGALFTSPSYFTFYTGLDMLHFSTPPHLVPEHEITSACPPPSPEMNIGSRIEGHGTAVVLLHSSMASKSQWRALMEGMRGTHRLIAIDLHGYGDSAMPECRGRFALADEVRLVQTKLAQVLQPEESFHLVGHSFGGGVALRLAHAAPERIRSLSLYEPTAFHLLDRGDPALEEIRSVARAVEAGMRDGRATGATERFIDYWNGAGAYAALPASRQALFVSLLPKVPLDFQALLDDPLRAADYSGIAVPACLIAGGESPDCTHAIVSILAATLAKRETYEIDAGHMAPLTHPELVNPIIDSFIRRIDAQHADALPSASKWMTA